jgi:hypothetical protein
MWQPYVLYLSSVRVETSIAPLTFLVFEHCLSGAIGWASRDLWFDLQSAVVEQTVLFKNWMDGSDSVSSLSVSHDKVCLFVSMAISFLIFEQMDCLVRNWIEEMNSARVLKKKIRFQEKHNKFWEEMLLHSLSFEMFRSIRRGKQKLSGLFLIAVGSLSMIHFYTK